MVDTHVVQSALKPLLEKIRRECFMPEYREKITDTECMGLVLSKYFEWGGIEIAEATVYALEDSNFHKLAGELEKLIEEEKKKI